MLKFMMLLSMAALIGSIFFGIMNQATLNNELSRIQELTAEWRRLSSDTEEAQGQLAALAQQMDSTRTANQQVRAELSLATNELTRKNAEMVRLDEKYAGMQARMDELKLMEEQLKGMTPAMVQSQYEQAQNTFKAKQEEMSKLENDLLAANSANEKNAERIEELKRQEEERRSSVARNAMEATIIAVNRDYGFVIVNAGSDLGVTPDASLLVQRDVDRIGRLRIVSVEPKVTVADIIPGSISPGAQIMVRDKVIFETVR